MPAFLSMPLADFSDYYFELSALRLSPTFRISLACLRFHFISPLSVFRHAFAISSADIDFFAFDTFSLHFYYYFLIAFIAGFHYCLIFIELNFISFILFQLIFIFSGCFSLEIGYISLSHISWIYLASHFDYVSFDIAAFDAFRYFFIDYLADLPHIRRFDTLLFLHFHLWHRSFDTELSEVFSPLIWHISAISFRQR